ncbi:hypothetical protein L6452_39336 [Arctium lappa]|uniref:Uncharacterized protein n=1 Tax=Arctium lappa TaxID=4217 RepID=A0ACB8XSX1_ARCLA|nr:hypothetical protein L6452_39336 [Arctium lappa]
MSLAQPWTITNVAPSSTYPSITTSAPGPSPVLASPCHLTHTSFTPSISSHFSSTATGLTSPTVVSTPSPVSKIYDYVDDPPSYSTTSTSSSTSPIQDATPTLPSSPDCEISLSIHLNSPLLRLLRFLPCLLLQQVLVIFIPCLPGLRLGSPNQKQFLT